MINRHEVKTTSLKDAILLVLVYFDTFRFPLKKEEILRFCAIPDASGEETDRVLGELTDLKILFCFGDYYSMSEAPQWIPEREANEARARKWLAWGRKIGRFIGYFPFVRAVFISGSLSKGVMPKGGDIDFFILTKPGRLWVARTLLVLFRKVILLNSHTFFCVNYFIDEDNLEIEEKNLFTATELATLLPVYGRDYYQPLMRQNIWYRTFYPNISLRDCEPAKKFRFSFSQNISEFLLGGRLGEWLDTFFMRMTLKHRQRKFKTYSQQDFDTALKARKYVSKHHPSHFQRKVEVAIQQRIEILAAKIGYTLPNPFTRPL